MYFVAQSQYGAGTACIARGLPTRMRFKSIASLLWTAACLGAAFAAASPSAADVPNSAVASRPGADAPIIAAADASAAYEPITVASRSRAEGPIIAAAETSAADEPTVAAASPSSADEQVSADAPGAGAPSGIRIAISDTAQYFTAPLRWDAEDWTYFGISLAAVAAAHAADSTVRSHFASGPKDGLNGGEDANSLRDAIPALALIGGTWALAGYLGDSDGYRETWRLLEAGVYSTVTAEALTYAAGRERPDGTTSDRWREGGDSFPSVHASAAFAIGMTFAESGSDDYRWIRRIVGYAVAAGTAYVRVKDNVHWLSDTVAGAAIGIATARFVLNRENGTHGAIAFAPQKGGWMLSYNVPLR